ncbi:hypothetical protein [Streptomyces sp. x-80]|uniref:hypothetical protein n=1 Tax=Streptomyces sp. x-80 TaxID=2789282 RepID=UPI003980762D
MTATASSVNSPTPATRPPWTTTGEIQPVARLTAVRRPATISRVSAAPGPRTY